MIIRTIPTHEDIESGRLAGQTVIVIDVLRASTTIAAAFDAGFSTVITVETEQEALSLKSENTILAGERHCEKRKGFDYNNSPTEICKKRHDGESLILMTTNGTKTIKKAELADHVLIGSFLNASSCAKKALAFSCDITICCAGTRGEFALEDGLAAGYMIYLLKKRTDPVHVCDFSEMLEASYLQLANQLPERLLTTTTGRRLVSKNYIDDIQFAGRLNRLNIVPFVKENRILPSVSS